MLTIEAIKNIGYVFLHGDLTDPKHGICDKYAKTYRYEDLHIEEKELVQLLNGYMKEVKTAKIKKDVKEISELMEQVSQLKIQRLLFGLKLLERYHLLTDTNKVNQLRIPRLIDYIYANMESDKELKESLRMELIRNTGRMVDATEHFIYTNEILDIKMPVSAWLRQIKFKSVSHKKENKEKFSNLDGLTVGQCAKKLGIKVRKLKSLEREGKIKVTRDNKNKRIYSPTLIEEIKEIL